MCLGLPPLGSLALTALRPVTWPARCCSILGMILIRRTPKPPSFHVACIFAYERCLGTRYITVPLQLLMRRGWEWQNQTAILVFNGDVHAAFDNMRPDSIVQALQSAKIHPRLTEAVLSESTGLQCWPEFGGVRLQSPVAFNKCARQGGVESAYEWNALMYRCFSTLGPLWLESDYGIQLDDRRYTHAVCADNV